MKHHASFPKTTWGKTRARPPEPPKAPRREPAFYLRPVEVPEDVPIGIARESVKAGDMVSMDLILRKGSAMAAAESGFPEFTPGFHLGGRFEDLEGRSVERPDVGILPPRPWPRR